jgi:hypothetical protein
MCTKRLWRFVKNYWILIYIQKQFFFFFWIIGKCIVDDAEKWIFSPRNTRTNFHKAPGIFYALLLV